MIAHTAQNASLTAHTASLIPLVIYLVLSLAIAFWARSARSVRSGTGSATPSGTKNGAGMASGAAMLVEYYAGGRSMGGFVLAMTIIASYTSASSFVGGPGVAYTLGFSWVLLAMIQVPTTFFTLGMLGKRFAIIARRTGAVTIADYLRARYQHDGVVLISSIALLVFFMAAMLAQCIGGARLLQVATGTSYETGLVLFALTVVVYTAIGGFRAVVITDALQGIVMIIASVVLLIAVIKAAGGVDNAVQTLKGIDVGLITPFGPDNAVPPPMMMSFWVLVGFGVLGLPQTTQKCLAYKDAKSMHQAMILGTLIIGFLLLCTHLAGTLGRAVMPNLAIGDLAIPTLTVNLLPPTLAGIFIAGPMAAIMSTVDSMLLLMSASIVKDIYVHHWLKGDASRITPRRMRWLSIISTSIMALIVFGAALDPPALLVWINLFAFGGLEAVFLWPIILGMYWKRANATGALFSMSVGLITYMLVSIVKPDMGGIHAIVPTVTLSLFAFVVGAYFGKKPDVAVIACFWGRPVEAVPKE